MSKPIQVRNVGRFRIYRAATMDAALSLVEDGRKVIHIEHGRDYGIDTMDRTRFPRDPWCDVVTDARKSR